MRRHPCFKAPEKGANICRMTIENPKGSGDFASTAKQFLAQAQSFCQRVPVLGKFWVILPGNVAVITLERRVCHKVAPTIEIFLVVSPGCSFHDVFRNTQASWITPLGD